MVDNPDKPWQFQKGNPGKKSLYKPEYGRTVMELMAQGYTMAAAAADLNVSAATLALWQKTHPEFKEMVDLGRIKRQRWWEEKLMTTGNSAHVAASLKALGNMKADDWIDTQKHELSGPDGAPLVIQAIQRTIVDVGDKPLVIEHDDNEEGAD